MLNSIVAVHNVWVFSTLFRAEAPLAIVVIAPGGGTPHPSVSSAVGGACVIRPTLEDEGEETGASLRVTPNSRDGRVRDGCCRDGSARIKIQ